METINSRRLDCYSLILGVAALTTLLTGAIPSVSLTYYGTTVGFFDFIQFLPEYQAVLTVIAMSGMVLTAMFAFVRVVPRPLCVILASSAFLSSLLAVATLNIGVVYSKRAVTASVYGAAVKDSVLNYGLEYNFVIVIFLIDGLCMTALSVMAMLAERRAAQKSASEVKPAEIKHEQHFRSPDAL